MTAVLRGCGEEWREVGLEVRQDLPLCPSDSAALAVEEGPCMGVFQMLLGSLFICRVLVPLTST